MGMTTGVRSGNLRQDSSEPDLAAMATLCAHRQRRCTLPLAAWVLVWLTAACATTPTGRTQLVAFSEADMAKMGRAAFTELKGQQARSTDAQATAYVRCVAGHITGTPR